MIEMIGYAALILAIAVGGFIAYASTKPDSFSVQRSTTVAAPPDRIYPLIADLKAMNTWNPFVAPDPNIRFTYSGPEQAKGATYTWAGNRNVGEGSFEITEAEPPRRVAGRLVMLKPMKADNAVEFTLQPGAGGTIVTWAMSGRQPLIGKVMSTIIDCDRMIGGQFEKGLSSLKSIAESKA